MYSICVASSFKSHRHLVRGVMVVNPALSTSVYRVVLEMRFVLGVCCSVAAKGVSFRTSLPRSFTVVRPSAR